MSLSFSEVKHAKEKEIVNEDTNTNDVKKHILLKFS